MNNFIKVLIISAFTFSGMTFAVSMKDLELKDLELNVKQLKNQTSMIKIGDAERVNNFNSSANKIANNAKNLNGQATGLRSSTIDDAAQLIEKHANILASLWYILPQPSRTPMITIPEKEKKQLEGLWQSAKNNLNSRKTLATSLINKSYFGSRKDIRQHLLDTFKILDTIHEEFKKWGKLFYKFID